MCGREKLLNHHIRRIVESNPDYAAVTPAIEKEILHHDIMDVLIQQGVLQRLSFIGGTSLRMCFNSSRLSEDLDFNGGYDFKPTDFNGLELQIQTYLEKKYETDVSVNRPVSKLEANTVSWKITIAKEANRPDLPRQKLHIDVCAIPSFDIEKRPLINHYNIVVPTEGILVAVQSLQEILADKLIALAYRTRRIKPRDIWDIVWIKQRGIAVSKTLVEQKLYAREKQLQDFQHTLSVQLQRLVSEDEVRVDFNEEMGRFIPQKLRQRTLDDPDYWLYVQREVTAVASGLFEDGSPKPQFDMGQS